jgi:hypothetical protein
MLPARGLIVTGHCLLYGGTNEGAGVAECGLDDRASISSKENIF